LRRIEDGSATAPLEVYIEEEQDQPTLWEPEPTEINDAVKLAHEVFEALGADAPLPERFPRALLQEYAKYEDRVEISGEVFEADVKKGRFQLWSGEDTAVSVAFTSEQEDQVTTALKEHKTARMYVKGLGEYSPQGKLLRVLQVDKLRLTTSERHYDKSARPIEDLLKELAREIPQEEWDKLPSDLNDNLDHYLYGVPKQ
jgi:hypothetical protein